jgi:hypothetical protein
VFLAYLRGLKFILIPQGANCKSGKSHKLILHFFPLLLNKNKELIAEAVGVLPVGGGIGCLTL